MTRQLPHVSIDDNSSSLLGAHSERVDSLIIIDRAADMITPLLTQLTYEGLIDELIGIKNCTCHFLVLNFCLLTSD